MSEPATIETHIPMPAGSIPAGFIAISSYVSADGDKAWSYTMQGLSAAEALGYMQMLSWMVAADGVADEEGEDDDD